MYRELSAHPRSDAMQVSNEDFYVGRWHVQPQLNRVTGPDGSHHLEPRVMRVLVCLAERPGEVVSRDELLDTVWADTIVSESSLTRTISDLRKVFDDDPHDPQVIETIRKGGYRLIAPVNLGGDSVRLDNVEVRSASPTPTPVDTARSLPWRWIVPAAVLVLVGVIGWPLVSATQDSSTTPLTPVPVTTYEGVEFDPRLSPDGEQLAFVWNGPKHDNWDIYVKPVGTETPRRVTTHPAFEGSPVWSPDGASVAFIRLSDSAQTCTVVVKPILGEDEREVADCHTYTESALAWSSDGRHLALADRLAPSEPFRIYLISLETLNVRPLTDPPSGAYGDLDPAFAPDGRRLAFVRGSIEGTMAKVLSPAIGDLYVTSVADGAVQRITSDQQEIPGLDWTPDGEGIVFASNRGGRGYGLWRTSVEDGTPELLHSINGQMIRNPALTRQSDHLVFETWSGNVNLWRVRVSDEQPTDPKLLLASTRWESNPQYSPNGTRLAFASNRSGYSEIWVSRTDGSNPVQLTSFEGPYVAMPRWSPDGRRIAFHARTEGHADVYVVEARGGTPHRLIDHPANDMAPSWSLDGQSIYFGSNRSGSWQIWKTPTAGGEATQVTHHGGITAFEVAGPSEPVLYYARSDTSGVWRRAASGEEMLVMPHLFSKDWGNWVPTADAIYFVDRTGDGQFISIYRFASGETERLIQPERNVPVGTSGLALHPNGTDLLYAQMHDAAADLMHVHPFP